LPGRRVEHLAVVRRARRVESRKRVAPHRVVVLGSEERPVGHQAARADEQRRHAQCQFRHLCGAQGHIPDRGLGDAPAEIVVPRTVAEAGDAHPIQANRCYAGGFRAYAATINVDSAGVQGAGNAAGMVPGIRSEARGGDRRDIRRRVAAGEVERVIDRRACCAQGEVVVVYVLVADKEQGLDDCRIITIEPARHGERLARDRRGVALQVFGCGIIEQSSHLRLLYLDPQQLSISRHVIVAVVGIPIDSQAE